MKRLLTLLLLCSSFLAARGADVPAIFWISDPVKPNETVLLSGGNFAPDARVELMRLEDGNPGTPAEPSLLPPATWKDAEILQASATALKFVIPADWKPGIYACRVRNGEAQSSLRFLNAPDVWWLQADGGDAATPGGWVRVFGRSLRADAAANLWLKPAAGGAGLTLPCTGTDVYAAQAALPADLAPGEYTVFAHNGWGASAGWSQAGSLRVQARAPFPETVFDVMDFYGKDRAKEIQRTLRRGSKPIDRTDAILAALKKAQDAGGGVVYFPAGTYGILRELKIPPRTVLKGEGMGLVVLRWGTGTFALDGGGSQQRDENAKDDYTGRLLFGDTFAIEDLSLYAPLSCNHAIQAGPNFAMRRVRVRVDRYWMRSGQRQDGVFLRVGKNFEVTDCDILAKASAIAVGSHGILARNKIQAGKCNCELGHAAQVIVEDNQFISLDPTAYINVYEEGRNIYYARNRHESIYAHQSDFSFTFDGTGGAYLGGIEKCEGSTVTLAADPTYVKWAGENSPLWKKSVVCILSGRGAGQYRFVTANKGREWTLDRPFEIQPDAASVLTIAPFRGRALVVGNRFEDANWVNMGYGSSIDVLCANNTLYRCGQLLNYGLKHEQGNQPSWYVQYIDNDLHEGHTLVESQSPLKAPPAFDGPVTRGAVHRGTRFFSDNSGNIRIGGNMVDALVENCRLDHPAGFIESAKQASGVLFRGNTFKSGEKYLGETAKIVPAAAAPAK